MSKNCISCRDSKPLDAFYVHPQMRDGHLNKCIDCCKEYAKTRHRLGLASPSNPKDRRREQDQKNAWGRRNRHKTRAHKAVRDAVDRGVLVRLPCERCGDHNSQAHHDDYSRPLDVLWLCPVHHGVRHQELNDMKEVAA